MSLYNLRQGKSSGRVSSAPAHHENINAAQAVPLNAPGAGPDVEMTASQQYPPQQAYNPAYGYYPTYDQQQAVPQFQQEQHPLNPQNTEAAGQPAWNPAPAATNQHWQYQPDPAQAQAQYQPAQQYQQHQQQSQYPYQNPQ